MQKVIKNILLILSVVLASFAHAHEQRASEASVKKLVQVMGMQKTLGKLLPQMEAMLQKMQESALKGDKLTDKEQEVVIRYQAKSWRLIQEELSWEKVEPVYIQAYLEVFTKEEVDGLIIFYSSEIGQALVDKLPVLTQKTMQEIQPRMAGLLPVTKSMQQELKALHEQEQSK
jgi:uncharacterized protein